MNWTAILQLLIELAPSIPKIITAWNAPTNTMTKVQTIAQSLSPEAQATLDQIAKTQFPRLAPAFGAAAALLQVAHPNAITYVQAGLNILGSAGVFTLPNGPLDEDGLWGPLTTAAAESAERAAGIPLTGALNDMLINWIAGRLASVKV